MTITRKEAIEIIKDFISLHDINHPVMVSLKILIPEFKMEDEKTKDEIINYFRCQSKEEPTRKEIYDKWIAWLEKQGEQKPIISENAIREGIAHFGITQYQIDNWLKKYVDVENKGE